METTAELSGGHCHGCEATITPVNNVTEDLPLSNTTDWETPIPGYGGGAGEIVSFEVYRGVLLYTSYCAVSAGVLGIFANILIIITYAKMGFSNSINVSYLSMAVSDLGCVLTTIWIIVLVAANFENYVALPVVPMDIITPTATWPNAAFSKATALITAYISLERCLCVAFPLKVKTFVTKKRTLIAMAVIYMVTLPPVCLIFLVYRFEWRVGYDNRTVLGARLVTTAEMSMLYNALYTLYGIVYHWLPLAIICICTVFLIIHLNRNARWRNQNASSALKTPAEGGEDGGGPGKTDGDKPAGGKINKSTQEDRVVKAVVFVAVCFIALTTPLSASTLVSVIEPEFRPFGRYTRIHSLFTAYDITSLMFNSSINIFIYYNLGSKFRKTLREVLHLAN